MSKTFSMCELHQFCGSEQLYKHQMNRRLVYTDGVRYLAMSAGCYWLIDEISLVIFPRLMKKQPDSFYSIQFVAHADDTASIAVGDGNGNIHIEHKISWTDFPVKEKQIQLYLCDSGNHYCLMLSGEY